MTNVVPHAQRFPLGSTEHFDVDVWRDLVIPLPNGTLKLTTTGGTITVVDQFGIDFNGSDFSKGVVMKYPGKYSVKLSAGSAEVTNTDSITAATKPENKPYNFWYWPFASTWTNYHLYIDGGVYEKVDKVYGLVHTSAATPFNTSAHMDRFADKPEHVFK